MDNPIKMDALGGTTKPTIFGNIPSSDIKRDHFFKAVCLVESTSLANLDGVREWVNGTYKWNILGL